MKISAQFSRCSDSVKKSNEISRAHRLSFSRAVAAPGGGSAIARRPSALFRAKKNADLTKSPYKPYES
ncbi:hypothetical protein [Roseovarius mucosus]|uniref:hypothetical protein n=1 Tax=Roseovarius mucosus TaxID=215743 RepID=UPI003BAB09E1